MYYADTFSRHLPRAMIHIEQTSLSEHNVMIKVGGVLDQDAVEVLKDVCNSNLARGNRVTVDFHSILHITREGRSFVKSIDKKVIVQRLPEFMTIDAEE